MYGHTAIFIKGDKFDYLFVSLDDKALSKLGILLTLKEPSKTAADNNHFFNKFSFEDNKA